MGMFEFHLAPRLHATNSAKGRTERLLRHPVNAGEFLYPDCPLVPGGTV
jgi:hypothetical protein